MALLRLGWFCAACLLAAPALAEDLRFAVAANFRDTFETLAATYLERTGTRTVASFGASGALYTQIVSGAPFDAFLSADVERPARLVSEGWAPAESRFTYALGQLVLWTPGHDAPDEAWLRGESRIAIANPELAPYGRAAQQLLERSSLWDTASTRLVVGGSIGQAMTFVASGGVPGGLVAHAQVNTLDPPAPPEHVWIVPATLYDPIEQQAVTLKRGNLPSAGTFLDFLRSEEGRAIIEHSGYGLP